MKVLSILMLFSLSNFAQVQNKNISGTEYFNSFDYKVIKNQARGFEIEAQMISLSHSIISYLDENPNYVSQLKQHTSKKKLAMVLVYTGMLIMNNNNGVLDGELSKDLLFSTNNLSSSKSIKKEISARYLLAEDFLKYARKVVPNDVRIMAWHSSNQLRMQKHETGKVSEETLDWIMQMTVDYPIFHLFNALTVASDYDFGAKREATLLEVVELMNSKDSPCFPPIKFLRKGEAKNCNTTKKTPFAMQGTSVYMGDSFLKKAIQLKDNNQSQVDVDKYLKKALGLYRRPKLFKPIKTKFWKLKRNLNDRIKLVKSLRKGKELPDNFFKSSKYLDIYKCSSCHQGGKAKRALHVNLP